MADTYSPRILIPILRDDPDFSALRVADRWEELKKVAVERRIAAVVAHAVRDQASPEQRLWCDQVLADSWRRHDECIRQLDYVLTLLSHGGIEVLSLKGPILGRRHFKLPFLRRPSADIDLAVRDSDLERAAALLGTHGYRLETTLHEARTTSHHLVMSTANRPRVELHTRLSHATRGIPVDELFEVACEHLLPTGRPARIPAPADELLGLMLHFANDRFSSFFHLYELRRVWQNADPALRMEVIRRAVQHRFSAVLWLTDLAMQTTWGEKFLPPEAAIPTTWLQNRLNIQLLEELSSTVVNRNKRTLAGRLKGRWLDLQTTDTAGDALTMVGLVLRVAQRQLRH